MTVAVVNFDPLRDARHKDAQAARECADWIAWLELGNKAARTLDSYERYAAALLRAWPNIASGSNSACAPDARRDFAP